DRAGRFRFDAVPAGGVTLRVLLIGYKPSSRTIRVTAGEGATADFALQSAPIGLDAVVVTATGEQTQREQSNAIHRFDAGDITSKAPVLDMSNLLSARAPGLIVQDAGGTTGTGTRIRIRGSNSLSLSNEPVVYVDGVRVENGPSSISVGVGRQTRLHVFNPIETFSPFRTGHRQEYGVAASGGADQTTYYVSGHWNQELGVYAANQNRQVSVLANLHQQAGPRADFQARVGYTSGKLRLPENDNNSLGVVSSAFLGRADTINQGYGFLTPAQSFSILTFQTIDRFTGTFQTNVRPWEWLVVHGVAGVDFTS